MNLSVKQHIDLRYGMLLLLGIMIHSLALDWNAFKVVPIIFSYPSWFAGICFPLIFLLYRGSFTFFPAAFTVFMRFIFLGFGILLFLVIQILIFPAAAATYDRYIILEFILLPVWGLCGFLYGAYPDATQKLLGKFAMCAAWGSFYSFGLRLIGVQDTFLFTEAGWPVRLIFLFGFCWYLSQCLTGKKPSRRALIGLIACSLEVIFTLQKPFIFATFFSVATLITIFRARLKRHQYRKTITRLLKLTVAIVLVLVTLNTIFPGSVVKKINDFIYLRVLHQREYDSDVGILRAGSGGRIDLWKAAWEDFGKSPWVGSGVKPLVLGNYAEVSMHNGYLDILFISGICGFSLFIYGLGIWLKKVVRSLKYTPLLLVQSSCFAYIIGVMMFNLGETTRLYFGPSYFIALVFGLSLRLAVDSCSKIKFTHSSQNPSTDSDALIKNETAK